MQRRIITVINTKKIHTYRHRYFAIWTADQHHTRQFQIKKNATKIYTQNNLTNTSEQKV